METMSKTSVTLEHDAAMALRDVKNKMSQEAGRVVPFSEVILMLSAFYLSNEGAATAELERVNAILRENGFEYPLGARGVHDMAMQQAAFLEELEACEQRDSQERAVDSD